MPAVSKSPTVPFCTPTLAPAPPCTGLSPPARPIRRSPNVRGNNPPPAAASSAWNAIRCRPPAVSPATFPPANARSSYTDPGRNLLLYPALPSTAPILQCTPCNSHVAGRAAAPAVPARSISANGAPALLRDTPCSQNSSSSLFRNRACSPSRVPGVIHPADPAHIPSTLPSLDIPPPAEFPLSLSAAAPT